MTRKTSIDEKNKNVTQGKEWKKKSFASKKKIASKILRS